MIKTTFPEFLADHPFIATYLAGLGFVGALIGSLSRPLGGWLSDKIGGAKGDAGRVRRHGRRSPPSPSTACRTAASPCSSASYMVIFLLAGMGNGSTYKMIPSIFAMLGRQEADEQGLDPKQTARRLQAAGGRGDRHRRCDRRLRRLPHPGRAAAGQPRRVGLVKAAETPAEKVAVAAAHADWSVPALWVFLGSYVVFAGDHLVRVPAAARCGVPRAQPRLGRRSDVALPNIPAAKRAGLAVDLARLAAEGDGWLTPEDRYALKTHGVCAQEQDHVFMVRVRVPGGVLPTPAGPRAGPASRRGTRADWLHLYDPPERRAALGRRPIGCPRCSTSSRRSASRPARRAGTPCATSWRPRTPASAWTSPSTASPTPGPCQTPSWLARRR